MLDIIIAFIQVPKEVEILQAYQGGVDIVPQEVVGLIIYQRGTHLYNPSLLVDTVVDRGVALVRVAIAVHQRSRP